MKNIDYGLQILPTTILHIANEPEFQWLLQPELKAIKDGLTYVENKDCAGWLQKSKYRGYLNEIGHREGVGITIYGSDKKVIGEWQ